jgi:hypothetical protein
MKDWIGLVIVVGAWWLIQVWLLPRFGVAT